MNALVLINAIKMQTVLITLDHTTALASQVLLVMGFHVRILMNAKTVLITAMLMLTVIIHLVLLTAPADLVMLVMGLIAQVN